MKSICGNCRRWVLANLGQIRTLTRVYISQTDSANSDFTDSELNGFINEGLRFLGALVKKPIDHIEFQLEAGKPAYTLPTDTVIITTAYQGDLSISGDVRPLQILTEEALAAIKPSWLDENSNSRGAPAFAILIDRRTVLVHPTPDTASSASGKKLHLGYVYQPATMSSDGTDPDLNIVYHDLISQYAAHLCWLTKLNKPDIGVALMGQVMEKAKRLENLIVKDTLNLGFTWGNFIDPDNDGIVMVRP